MSVTRVLQSGSGDSSTGARAARFYDLEERWHDTSANERSAFQAWLLDFCEALGVDAPSPPTEGYRFELPVHVIDRDGRESTNFIDCWKADHFALEAKASEGGKDDTALFRKAFGQVRNYVAHVSGDPPPYLMVVDVPRSLMVWDRWSGAYGDFAAGRRIVLSTLHEQPDEITLLYDVFVQPWVRDPRGKAQAVTREIAARLAELAAELESRGLETERVARFLMRCVFSCFAEDVGLLPDKLFRRTLETARHSNDPQRLSLALTSLWETMDQGGMFGAEMLHRFNGRFFESVEALPLEPRDVDLLIDAAKHDWSGVEPSIFGTLLVRALDPEERHRLGAEYTPPQYIERLVEPTVIEPIRERWTAVQAAVLQLEETGKKKDKAAAIKQLRGFHDWLRNLAFLDPACGSGNFLYVTMAAVKRIELEVLNEITRLSGEQAGLVLDEVHPRQFHGIEVKQWAREIAELTLWIGYHQFWRETHGGRTPPDPILEDTGTIECRDAVLAWDAIVHRPDKDVADPTPRIPHPITGELVPDPEAELRYYEHVGARQASWPRADFIIGNPPYLGKSRKRVALGNGYVDALQDAYPEVAPAADLVMLWWYRAAQEVSSGRTIRAGLITTNSIIQRQNRTVIDSAFSHGVRVVWAAPDHPWVDEIGGAAVRVAMTVLAMPPAGTETRAARIEVNQRAEIIRVLRPPRLNSDLSGGIDVLAAAAKPLLANKGLATVGYKLYGGGFILPRAEAEQVLAIDYRNSEVVRLYITARELASRSKDRFVIDFGNRREEEARSFPVPFDLVRTRVKPHRDANANTDIRERWWQLGHLRQQLRSGLSGLRRFVATPETARHRFFVFVDATVAPEGSVFCITVDDPFMLGVLSSRLHAEWAAAAAGKLGVGNDFRYNKYCFDGFPAPARTTHLEQQVADLAERIDLHRKAALAHDSRVTMTGMYNVVEKLRSNESLSTEERLIHDAAACGVLREFHDELDQLIAECYGWPWPIESAQVLERLVALHDERLAEEQNGLVRWLRPEYQVPRFAPTDATQKLDLAEEVAARPGVTTETRQWPRTAVDQLAALGALLDQRPITLDEAMAAFSGAQRSLIARHLETLTLMGEITRNADGQYSGVLKAA